MIVSVGWLSRLSADPWVGGDSVSDLGVLAGQVDLFGQVASQSTAHRVIQSIGPDQLEAIRAARAKARAAAGRPEAALNL